MTLGEKIVKLRAVQRLSQGDLAERLGVSRQSVSKWETGGSTPDLDKLIALSELFGITLDELAKPDRPAQNPLPQTETPAAPPPKIETRKIAGWILLGVGLLSIVLGLALDLLLVFLGGYLALCGVVCLLVKKHPGLVVGWSTFLVCVYFLPRVTSTGLRIIFLPFAYREELWIQLIVAYCFWALLLLLLARTIKTTRLGKHPLLFLGWVLLSQNYGFIRMLFDSAKQPWPHLVFAWCILLLSIGLTGLTARVVVQRYRAAE